MRNVRGVQGMMKRVTHLGMLPIEGDWAVSVDLELARRAEGVLL